MVRWSKGNKRIIIEQLLVDHNLVGNVLNSIGIWGLATYSSTVSRLRESNKPIVIVLMVRQVENQTKKCE